MSFALFLLVNAMIFIRPAEFHPALYDQPIYEVCILSCLAFSYTAVVERLAPKDLASRPINACAAGMLVAIVFSHLANGDPVAAYQSGVEFFKLLIYYFLLVSVVDTATKLDRFLTAIGVFSSFITALAVMHYYGVVEISAITFLETDTDGSGSAESMIRRLGSTGLFMDPNDLSLMLVMAMTVCIYQIIERRRLYWVVPLAQFAHALMLTHSRGGFLGLLAALVVLLVSRYGRRAVPLGLLVLPGVFFLFAGRQTSISLGSGTGASRIELWHEGMILFVRHPLFGVGSDRYVEYAGHVAHNSFIHCYTELGLLGGTIFLSAFYIAIASLWRLGKADVPLVSPELKRMRPYVLAIVAGYTGGLMSLSNPYTIPTYTVLGLASVYVRLAETELGVPLLRLEGPLLRRLAALSLAFIVVAQVGVRFLVRLAG